jgi:molybdate transport system substrate-binding protein
MRRPLVWLAALLCVAAGAVQAADEATPAPITVFGAASLTNVLQDLGDVFTKQTQIPVRFSFAASSALAKQIENGAPADLFFSADIEWMDYLEQRNLIQRVSRYNRVGNKLVLIAPLDSRVKLKIEPHFALAGALGKDRLATGDPDSVPVGRYAKQALMHLQVWKDVEGRLVRADSVRAALSFVDRGEAAFGIVYETDALVDKKVQVIDVFPADSHEPIVYPVALTANARAEAQKLLTYIIGAGADPAFKHYGFTPLH